MVFEALAAEDRAALGAVVADRRLRERLPALTPEPACDAIDSGRNAVSIAASDPEGRPWTLTFRRSGTRWRLTSASPVSP